MNESIDSLSMRRTPRCAPFCDLRHIDHETNEELLTYQMRFVPFRASVATVEVRNNIGVYEQQFDG